MAPSDDQFVRTHIQSLVQKIRVGASADTLPLGIVEAIETWPALIPKAGGVLLRHRGLLDSARRNPAVAIELLREDYDGVGANVENAVLQSGEHTIQLLHLVTAQRRPARLDEAYYRNALINDPYWGLRFADETGNDSLRQQIHDWSEQNREKSAGAAWAYLLRHPEEQTYHYTRLLRKSRPYFWLSLQTLGTRLAAPSAAEVIETVGDSPRWAAHFAWSGWHPQSLMPVMSRNPAWLAEYLIESGAVWDSHEASACVDLTRRRAHDEAEYGGTRRPILGPVTAFYDRLFKTYDVDLAAPAVASATGHDREGVPAPAL